jgi:myo-inositol 2-dehydrogenase/D-chiro-inositol 1-dehydrogenase
MGLTHLRALDGSDLLAIAAVAEPSPRAREAVAGSGMPVCASVAEMLDRCPLDGVLIAAPSDLHGQIVAEVAASGLPILCEKPCGVTSAQARASARAAAEAGVALQVAFWRRYVPSLRALRDQIAAGALRRLLLVCSYQWDQAPPASSSTRPGSG